MNRKAGYLGLGVVLGAAATAAAPQALSYVSPAAYAAASDTYRQLNLFGDVFDTIRNDYVEKPDEAKLIEAAINGILASLRAANPPCRPRKALSLCSGLSISWSGKRNFAG